MLSVVLISLLPLAFAVPAQERIIGGDDVQSATTYPWQGSLERLSSHTCGCVLIHADWVLSAAHCLEGTVGSYSVRFGSLTRGEGDLYNFDSILQHEDYGTGQGSFPNDIGLLKTSRSVSMGSTVATIAIDSSNSLETDCAITGWGDDGGVGLPMTLQEATPMDLLNDNECSQEWGLSYNGDVHVCVQDLPNQNKGACSGDSGGPLVCPATGNSLLRGVTSWGHRSCDPVYPSVYTRVSNYITWVCQNTGGDVC